MSVKLGDHEVEFYNELVNEALPYYNMRGSTVYFLQKSDTVTFKLKADSRDYLLKIHNQAQTRDSIESELMWLTAIKEDTDLVAMELLVTQGIIDEKVYLVYQETVKMMKQEIEAFPMSEANWGLIHSDLHESNYQVDRLLEAFILWAVIRGY
ncbi:hypothetical protein [Paenibacillus sp. SN-8-1]|uniref:hypothetical protein n=1 Tax=Paenibacillus sp. SN-8-1 TaxID=3435409 RepID=UPI003D9A665A